MHPTRAANENSLAARLPKLGAFFNPGGLGQHEICARPTLRAGHPYFITKPPHNEDGHGGYTRLNRFDADGIPYKPADRGRLYHPLVLARYAIRMLQIAHEQNDPSAAGRARRMLLPLLESGRRDGVWGAGPTPQSMRAAHPSAMVQGVVLSALARLGAGRRDKEVAATMECAVERMLRSEANGGTRSQLEAGPFLEEAPCTSVKHILNGCIYGLFGLYDTADVLGHEQARLVAEEVERTLASVIGQFIAPCGWSYYCLAAYGRRYLASASYHGWHVLQLRVVSARSGLTGLGRAAALWTRAHDSPPRRALIGAAKTAQAIWLRDIRGLRLDVCP